MIVRAKTKRRIVALLIVFVVLAGSGAGLYGWRVQQLRGDARASLRDGRAALASHDYRAALHSIGRYLNRFPEDTEALYDYAQARRHVVEPQAKHLRDAAAPLRQVLRRQPEHLAARGDLVEIYRQLGFSSELLAASEQLLEAQPDDPRGWRGKAVALHRLGRQPEALAACERFNELAPLDVEGRILTLTIAQAAGAAKEQLVERAAGWRQEHPDDARFTLLLGIAYRLTGDERPSLALAHEAAQQAVPDVPFLLALVKLLDSNGQFEASLAVLRRAAEEVQAPELTAALARRLWEAGRLPELLARVESVDVDAPQTDGDVLGLKAVCLLELGRTDEARAVVEVLERDVGDERAQAWAAMLHAALQGQQAGAAQWIAAAREALALSPNHPYFRFFLGEGYYRLGEADLAVEAWTRASARAPAWAAPLMRIADTYLETDRASLALPVAQSAMQRAPHSVDAGVLLVRAWAANMDQQPSETAAALLEAVERLRQAAPDDSRLAPIHVDLIARSRGVEDARTALQAELDASAAARPDTLLRLARVSRQWGLGLSEACLQTYEHAYGDTLDLAYEQAMELSLAGEPEEGLRRLDAARGRTDNALAWRITRTRFLDHMSNPAALAAWTELADEHAQDARVQRMVLKSPTAWRDRPLIDRTVDRLRSLTGEQSLDWRMARARWLLEGESGQANLNAAVLLLSDIIRSSSNLVEARMLMADALDRLGNTSGAIEHLASAASLSGTSGGNRRVRLWLARLLQEQGNRDQARAILERVAADESATAADLHTAASLLARQSSHAQAIGLLERASTADDARGKLLLARLYAATDDPEKAEAVCRELLIAPTPAALEFIADFYARQGRDDEAEQVLARLDDVEMAAGTRELVRAGFNARHRGVEPALSALRSATEAAPANAEVWLARINFLLRLGRPDEARQVIEAGLAAAPENTTLRFLAEHDSLLTLAASHYTFRPLVMALAQDGGHRAAAVEALGVLARAEQRQMAMEDVIVQLRRLVDRHPRFLPLNDLMVRMYAGAGRHDEAAALAARAMAAYPEAPEPAWLAASSMAAAGRWNEALTVAREWRVRSANDTLAADLLISEAQVRLGDARSALERTEPYLDQALAEPLAYMPVLTSRARALIAADRVADAEALLEPLLGQDALWRVEWISLAVLAVPQAEASAAWLEKAEAAVPDDSAHEQLFLVRGWSALARRWQEPRFATRAATLVDALAQRAGDDAELLLTLAAALEGQGEMERAATLYRRVLALTPNAAAMNNLAMILLQTGGDVPEARRLAEEAVQAQPGNPYFLDTLAEAQARSGANDEALATIRRAVAADPERADWRVRLARMLADAGDIGESLRVVEQVRRHHQARATTLSPELTEELDRLTARLQTGL